MKPYAGCLLVYWTGWAALPVVAAPPCYNEWQTFGKADGLPSEKAMCVLATDAGVWVGTDHGLARYDQGVWTTYTPKEGLGHEGVLSLAQDPATGDIWAGTLHGLSRFSGGRFKTYTQLNSGLANDVVYGVAVHRGEVWAATAAGTSRYDLVANRWTIYDQSNTSMHENWCYAVTSAGDKVYLGVWGGGLMEYQSERDLWKQYRDPDGEMDIVLFINAGLIHDVVATVTYDAAQRVWAGTYFGLSSYDGRKWRNFMDHDSPLVSNFINFVRAQGEYCWIGTDNGLNATDRENWWSYRRDPETGKGKITWRPVGGSAESFTTETIFPHNYILGISFQAEDIWLATEKGVTRGTLSPARAAEKTARGSQPGMEKRTTAR